MPPIPASRDNPYTGSPLDRASALREDAAAVAALLADPESLVLPVWRGRNLMAARPDGGQEAVMLTGVGMSRPGRPSSFARRSMASAAAVKSHAG